MSKLRSVSTGFWSDPFIEDLTPTDKLLFLYLITNEKTNMLGIYESSVKKISFETGIAIDKIKSGLKLFEKLNKVKYVNNYVILVNYMKHQNFNTNMKKSAIDIYNNLPNELIDSNLNISKDDPLKGFESLLNHYGMVRKVEVEYEVEEETETKEEAKDKKEDFKKSLSPFLEKYGKDLLNDFFMYWTEKSPNGKKMRFEKEKVFDPERRLVTWFANGEKFNKEKKSGEKKKEGKIQGFIDQSNNLKEMFND
jgi:hypothetical protein